MFAAERKCRWTREYLCTRRVGGKRRRSGTRLVRERRAQLGFVVGQLFAGSLRNSSPSFVEGTTGEEGSCLRNIFHKGCLGKKQGRRAFRLDLAFVVHFSEENIRTYALSILLLDPINRINFLLNSVKNWSSLDRFVVAGKRNGTRLRPAFSSRARGNYDFESNKYLQSLCAEHVTGGETSKGGRRTKLQRARSTRHANSRLRII